MISLKLSLYEPVNDLFLLETETPKIKKEDYDVSATGIVLTRKSVVESRSVIGKIVKMGPKCTDTYKIGDVINYYPNAGLDVIFADSDNLHVIMGEEKFLAKC